MSDLASQLAAHSEVLIRNAGDISTYHLPELPESEAQDVFERITAHEAALASRDLTTDGYIKGSAKIDDDIHKVASTTSALLTAEHATRHPRNSKIIRADWGTAGLGQVLHEDTGAGFLAAIGRQTGDPNHDEEHVFKDTISTIMVAEKPLVVAGLHGFPAGKFGSLTDTRAYDIVLGTGDMANERSARLAEAVKSFAAGLGLNAVINQPHIRFEGGQPLMREDGTPKTMTLKAAGYNTTRSLEQRTSEHLGYGPALVQVEHSELLRRMPNDRQFDRRSNIMGVYLGYLVDKHLIKLGSNPDF